MKIKDLGKIITGKTPSTKKPELFGYDYPFITPSDINTYEVYYVQDTERGLSKEGYLTQKSKLLPPKTVCYVCIGSTIGKICLTKKPSFTNQQLNNIIVDQSRYVPEYIYYRLRYETPKIQSISGGTGSGKAIYNKTAFEEFQFEIHDLPLQHKISSILSTYDDLIENNTRRIQILEEMAQRIYREWFVDFRFPGHEKVKFVDSEMGKIPEGWEVKRLGDAIELAYGKGLKASERKSGSVPVFGSGGIVGYHNQSLVKGPGIIVGRKGNVGSIFWSDRDFFPIDTVFYVRTTICLHYVYYYLRQMNFINSDAAVPGLNRNQAYLLPFLIPSEELVDVFQERICSNFKLVTVLKSKCEILRTSRDILLPKLISGELDVSDLDIAIREQE
ncbi:MAG: restriction endonuclease subunit S [bacterium]